jgi:hypothetical protein
VKAAAAVDRIEAGGVGGTGRIPTPGSYRGTFTQALLTNPAQWQASQERDREHAEWLAAMEPFQKEADACLEALKKAARAHGSRGQRARIRSMSAQETYKTFVQERYRSHVERSAGAIARTSPRIEAVDTRAGKQVRD